jgi:hypothetical protein
MTYSKTLRELIATDAADIETCGRYDERPVERLATGGRSLPGLSGLSRRPCVSDRHRNPHLVSRDDILDPQANQCNGGVGKRLIRTRIRMLAEGLR